MYWVIVCLVTEVYNIYNKPGNRYKANIIKEEGYGAQRTYGFFM